jgi:hypothetical protein
VHVCFGSQSVVDDDAVRLRNGLLLGQRQATPFGAHARTADMLRSIMKRIAEAIQMFCRRRRMVLAIAASNRHTPIIMIKKNKKRR